MLPLGYPFSLRLQLPPPPSGLLFGHLVAAQVQGLLAGHAPVVGLLPQPVVLQGGFVVHRQPLDGVGGKSLEGQRAEGGAVSRRRPPAGQKGRVRLTFR